MKIREVMTRHVESCPPDTNLAVAADTLWRKDCGALVVRGPAGELLGIATDRDMFIALGTRDRRASEVTIADVMSRRPVTCSEDEDVRTGLERMRRAKVRRLPVIDAHRRIIGILSLDDLAACAAPAGRPGDASGLAESGLDESDVIATLKSVCERIPSARPT